VTKIHKSTRRMLSSNFHDTIIPLFIVAYNSTVWHCVATFMKNYLFYQGCPYIFGE
jgi:hypothetical protein